jgi:hypothetical protein
MNKVTGLENPLPSLSPQKKGKENNWSDENICPSDTGTKQKVLTSYYSEIIIIYNLIG